MADVEVNKQTGKIRILHLTGVQDVGLAISPGLVENQMTGSLIQTASRALHEGIQYTPSLVTSQDWVTYPIMRFKEHPSVTVRCSSGPTRCRRAPASRWCPARRPQSPTRSSTRRACGSGRCR